MLIGLILLYANIYPGTANAKIGPITDPTRQKTHGPTRIEHQSKTYSAGSPKMIANQPVINKILEITVTYYLTFLI